MERHGDGLGWGKGRTQMNLGSRYQLLEPKHRFGAEFHISLALPQLWQVGDTYRIACLSLKKATAYSRDAKIYARDKGKG